MRALLCLLLLTQPLVAKDKGAPLVDAPVATSGDEATSVAEQSGDLPLVDLFARAILGIPDDGRIQLGGWTNAVREAPGVYQLSSDTGEPGGVFVISEPQPCLFSAAVQDEQGQHLARFEFDANQLEDIALELVRQDNGVNIIRSNFQPAQLQSFGPDGAAGGPPPTSQGDYRTSLTLEEMEAAGAALLEACAAANQ